MTRPLPEIGSQLSAALEAVTSELGQLDGRWPGLVAEHADAGGPVPRAEAHVRLGDGFAAHPLFRTYEALGAALAALRQHNSVPGWHEGEPGSEAEGLDEAAAAAGGASTIFAAPTAPLTPTNPVTPTPLCPPTAPSTPSPGPAPQGGGISDAGEGRVGRPGDEASSASDLDEASVVIVGRSPATVRRPEATPREILGTPRPGSRSLRERPGAVPGDAASVPPPATRSLRERLGSVLARSPEPPAAPVERPDRRSRLPAPPARRGSGLWRDEASVTIVRGPGEQPERRGGGGEPPVLGPGIPDADGDR